MMRGVITALVALAFVLPCGVAAAGITGTVVEVQDGDTLLVRLGAHVLSIDLRDVDAPEAGEPYANRARESLTQICRRGVVLEDYGIAARQHVVADALCDGTDAAAEQVRRGLATVDAGSAPADSPLRAIEREAKAERRGMWGDAAATAQ